MPTALGPEAQEAIGLCICCDALKELVNHAMLQFTPVSTTAGEMEVRFHTFVHRDLFLVRLLDFLSEKGSAELLGQKSSALGVLEQACATPALSPGYAAEELADAVAAMKQWMDTSIEPKFWLPTISEDVRMKVSRLQLLRVSGNQAKHNPSRLTGVSQEVQRWLSDHHQDVPLEIIPFVLDDLRDHLSDNLFVYYASWIAELLNNIRWGIQRYLLPVYAQAYRSEPERFPGFYRFEPPIGIVQGSPAYTWFHNLMNHVRAEPIIPPFRASQFLREQSSLEW